MRRSGTFCRPFFLFFVLMLFWFGNSLISPVFSKHHRIPFSFSFFPKGNTSIAFIDEERKKSKHQATRLMRDMLTWQLTKNKTNYPSSCRYPGFRRKQSGEPSQTLSVLHPYHLSPPKGHLQLGRQSATHLHFLPQALQLLWGISLGGRSMLDNPPQTHTHTQSNPQPTRRFGGRLPQIRGTLLRCVP